MQNLFYNIFLLRDILPIVSQNGLQRKLKQKISMDHTCRPSIEARTTLRSEVHIKVQNIFAKILKYKTIKDRLLPTLKVSPAAYIPHKSCQYRVILDLSFRLFVNDKYLSLVNDDNVKISPQSQWVN